MEHTEGDIKEMKRLAILSVGVATISFMAGFALGIMYGIGG